MASAPLVSGLVLVVIGVVTAGLTVAGVTVSVRGYDLVAISAGGFAITFAVWGLLSATNARYHQAIGLLTGAAGLTLLFLQPVARSDLLFGVTGAIVTLASGGSLVAAALGFDHLVVESDDHTSGQTNEDVDAGR